MEQKKKQKQEGTSTSSDYRRPLFGSQSNALDCDMQEKNSNKFTFASECRAADDNLIDPLRIPPADDTGVTSIERKWDEHQISYYSLGYSINCEL